jgi:hypothetical protein
MLSIGASAPGMAKEIPFNVQQGGTLPQVEGERDLPCPSGIGKAGLGRRATPALATSD